MSEAHESALVHPPGGVAMQLRGERLDLLPQRAVYWPRRRTLLVADPHFGKAGVFRRAGVALPAGDTAEDLERLTRIVSVTAAERLVVLGDFFHASPDADEPWLQAFLSWRGRHSALAVTVVAGNHDRNIRAPVRGMALEWSMDPLHEPPFVLSHEPEADPRGYVLGGHLHPVMWLRGGGDSLRPPVFWLRRHALVLPAFGSFTGGQAIALSADEGVFIAGADVVIPAGEVARVSAGRNDVG